MKLLIDIRLETAGSKATNLDVMRQAGLPVPAFSVYSYDCFDQVICQKDLAAFQVEFDQQKWSIEDLSQVLQEWARNLFKLEDLSAIEELHERTDTSFSVRSSATVEDGASSSFAGQFVTQLYTRPADLPQALESVFLSLFEVSALTYFFQQGLRLEQVRMVAVVQRMVAGELSGIYFTANPKGLLNEHIIVLGEGDGSGIVEDRVPTTMITYHPTEDLYYQEKTGASPDLASPDFKRLADLASQVQDLFGSYLDIEFTYDEGQFYLLQARPITTLPKGELTILDNSNIVESYPSLSKPLTISFVKEAYCQIFRSLASRLLKGDQKDLAAYELTFQRMVTAVNHRFYYQIDAWYQLLQLLPFSNKIIPIWQEMLGVRHTRVPSMPIHLSKWRRFETTVQIIKNFWTVPRQMANLEVSFQQIQADFERDFSEEATPEELKRLFDRLTTDILAKWDITLINDLYAFVYTGLLKKMTDSDDVQASIAGIEEIESMKPTRALSACVRLVRENPAYLTRLERLTAEQIPNFLGEDNELARALSSFITLYGDRAPEELKLETHTYRTHPQKLIRLVLQGAKVSDDYPTSKTTAQKHFWPWQKWVRRAAKRGILYRESSRLNRTRIYGMVRQIFRALGQQLVERGVLNDVDEVFYLQMEEVFSYPQAAEVDVNQIRQEIAQRQKEYERDSTLPTFSRLEYVGDIFEKHPQVADHLMWEQEDCRILQGIGCAPGKVRAQVLVVEDVQNIDNAQNRIIVTKMTDPGWVYLLSASKGIIAEQGSLLSHTAIISRELGIPSVVGISHATQLLKTGEWVELDGMTGQIKRLEKNDD